MFLARKDRFGILGEKPRRTRNEEIDSIKGRLRNKSSINSSSLRAERIGDFSESKQKIV